MEIGDGSGVYWRFARDSGNAFRMDLSNRLGIMGGNVGIGTTSPGNKLDVNGGVVVSPNTAGKNTFELSTHASDEGRLRIKNGDTTTVQIRAGGDTYFNGGNVGIGIAPAAGIKLNVNGAIQLSAPDYRIQAKPLPHEGKLSTPVLGFRGVGWHEGYTVLVPDTEGFRVVNWINNECNLELKEDGDLCIWNGLVKAEDFEIWSDSRIKLEQKSLEYGLAEILQLSVKRFLRAAWKKSRETGVIEIDEENTTNDFGVVAQEVYEIIPEAVSKPEDENKELWSLSYAKLIPVLIKAVQEQQEQIEELKQEIEALKAQ